MKKWIFIMFVSVLCLVGCKSEEAKTTEDAINKIGTVSIESGMLIEEAQKYYDALTDDQKKDVKNYKILVDAQEMYEKLQIEQSQEMFNLALSHEEQKEYELALEYYKQVNSIDEDNYKKAQPKIKELQETINANKTAAIGIIVLMENKYIDNIYDASDLKVKSDKGEISCWIDDIGYIISKQSYHDAEYHPAKKTGTNGYYVTKYKAAFSNNGRMTATLNWILQDTSKALFMTKELAFTADSLDYSLIKDYISEYQESGILPK